uniref:Treslin N-terminal domain-containing protein n=1 Tax=Callorhinchus milii TaxID=7868 RepID=A0A4W3I1G0_CALMI
MASRSLVFLLDSRGDGAGPGPGLGLAARRSCLRLLTRAACGFGFQRVRWGFRLFPSGPGGSRGPGLGRDFRELRPSDLRGLEEALGRQAEARAAGPSGAAAIQAALREALSDYQWDRPDLTSPAKRGRGRRRAAEEDGQPRDCKALFLCARCPHSRAELLRFLGPGHSEQPLADSLLPPGLRALLTGRGIGLHWLDTSPPPQVRYTLPMISEVLQLVGGNLIPFAALLQLSYVPECERLLEDPGFGKPTVQQEEGAEDKKESCSVTLEPVSSSQKYLPGPVNIAIRGAVKDWDPPKANLLSTHSWILQWPESRQTAESSLLQQLLQKITHNRIYLFFNNNGRFLLNPTVLSACEGVAVPHWVRQELAQGPRHGACFAESWFPLSELSGATGIPRTPLRQKMKSMSRSLQMLNVARLNVKAQKCQPEATPLPVTEPARHQAKRHFKNDEELMSSLEENYQKHVVEEELSQLSFVQNTVTIVHTYLQSGSAKCINLIQTHLLKTSKSIRQQYGNQENKDTKVRDCVLCFRYLLVLPQILGELYYGMGQSVPACLASVLPADFFSDESMSQESESPSNLLMSSLPLDTACTDAPDTQLDELRTRSSRKRRSIPLTRHRSISEVSHNLRQIQMPKKPLRLVSWGRMCVFKFSKLLKDTRILVTKVRRNLFNQEMLSPRKKSKMRRTQSVSAVEGRNHQHRKEKASNVHRKLLTKKVCETPLHKQMSTKHLLYHCAEFTDCFFSIEPILRRSPRFQKASLTKRHSISFYGGSQPTPHSGAESRTQGAEEPDSCFGNVVPGETAAESLHCGETKPTACKRWPKEMSGRSKHLGKSCFHAASVLDTSYSGLLSQTAVGDLMSDVSLVSERLDSSSLASTTDSGAASSQAEESSDILDAQLALDECADLQIRFTELLNTDTSDSVPSAHPHTHTSPTPYEFRWTPDRRQRLAAAMQRTSEVPRKIHPSQTPMAQHLLPIPTYKVELEMQDSGLPKLRFKRTNSVCVPQEESSVPKDSETGFCVRKSGCQSPPADGTPGCAKHAGHISPSICLHSSHSTPAKATPGKGGVQTFICQSYTPTRCSSTTSSPSQAEPGTVPWTPSPTQKSKPSQTPDAIKNWPRKKKAAHTPWSGDKGEYIASENDVESHSEHYSNKTMPLEEIGMEGVSRLPDQSPGAEREWRSQEGSSQSFGLRSRKRGRSSPGGELDRPAKTQRVDLTAVSSMDVGSVLQGKAKETSSAKKRSCAPGNL